MPTEFATEMLGIISMVLSAMTGAIAAVLSYIFYLGLRYATRTSGWAILRANIWFWAAVAASQFANLYLDLQIVTGRFPVPGSYYEMGIPIDTIMMVTAMYYLWATVRRNPPEPISVPIPMQGQHRMRGSH